VLAALFLAGSAAAKPPGSEAAATVALQWNANAVAAVRAATTTNELPPGMVSRPLYQTEGLLYVSYVQAAVYDAATKIGHRYMPYHHFSAGAGNASIEAAVVAAAYNTLVYYLGDPSGTLKTEYQASIAALPGDKATARGIAVGEAAAADIEALRANDGRNGPSPPGLGAGPPQPGLWVWAPLPSLQIAQTPWMAVMQPFMLDSTSQFRAPAPPPLDSTQYATDLKETRDFGSNLPVGDPRQARTQDQTKIAYFWNANAINQLNQTLQNVATQHNMDLLDTTRLLAAGNMVSTDAGMACFDSKYTYLRWRPVTAIRNDATNPDPTWTPLVTTPNHPEYPSQHGCVTSALAQVLANAVGNGTTTINATIPGATGGGTALTPGVTQTFATVEDLLAQLVNARVWIGFHFRTSVLAGETLGTEVANWELQRYFLPTGNRDG
jgi:hypothetical protein